MTCSVTKATTIQFTDGKCHIKKRKSGKTALSSYYMHLSHDLLLMALGTDTQTHNQCLRTKRIQETRHAQVWFKSNSRLLFEK